MNPGIRQAGASGNSAAPAGRRAPGPFGDIGSRTCRSSAASPPHRPGRL